MKKYANIGSVAILVSVICLILLFVYGLACLSVLGKWRLSLTRDKSGEKLFGDTAHFELYRQVKDPRQRIGELIAPARILEYTNLILFSATGLVLVGVFMGIAVKAIKMAKLTGAKGDKVVEGLFAKDGRDQSEGSLFSQATKNIANQVASKKPGILFGDIAGKLTPSSPQKEPSDDDRIIGLAESALGGSFVIGLGLTAVVYGLSSIFMYLDKHFRKIIETDFRRIHMEFKEIGEILHGLYLEVEDKERGWVTKVAESLRSKRTWKIRETDWDKALLAGLLYSVMANAGTDKRDDALSFLSRLDVSSPSIMQEFAEFIPFNNPKDIRTYLADFLQKGADKGRSEEIVNDIRNRMINAKNHFSDLKRHHVEYLMKMGIIVMSVLIGLISVSGLVYYNRTIIMEKLSGLANKFSQGENGDNE